MKDQRTKPMWTRMWAVSAILALFLSVCNGKAQTWTFQGSQICYTDTGLPAPSAGTNTGYQDQTSSPPSTPRSSSAVDPSSSKGGFGPYTFLITANLPPPKGFDLPTAEDFLTQNGANLFVFSQDWDKIEPSSGHYDLTNTITNPFTLVIPKYPFKGVVLILKMIDTNNRTMPADLKNKPFDDPQVEQRFLKMLHMVATAPGVASHVNYILLGNEVDSYFDVHPGELAGFMSLLKASIDQLHHDLPVMKVGTITTFSVPIGDGGNPSPSGEASFGVTWSRATLPAGSAHEDRS